MNKYSCMVALLIACSSSPPIGPDGGPPASDTDCSSALIQLDSPYEANTALSGFGGFAVDDRGAVFTTMPDPTLVTDTTDYPTQLIASDLSGVRTQLLSTKGIISSLVLAGDQIYFTVYYGDSGLHVISRSGGAPRLLDANATSEPVAIGSMLYYLADSQIMSVDPASGATQVVSDRGDLYVFALTASDGALYWFEGDFAGTAPYTLYKLIIGGAPQVFASVPQDNAGGLDVAGGVAYSDLIGDSYDLELYRIAQGGAPVRVQAVEGLPLVFTSDAAYYASYSGLAKNTLAFDDESIVDGSQDKVISAIAVGPSDLWYASKSCIFRGAK